MPPEPERPPLERLLDLAVYAPIGMYTALKEELPAFTRQGRQVVENRVMLARFIGQMAVQQGRRELDKRLAARRPPASAAVVDAVAHDATPTAAAGGTDRAEPGPADAVPRADSLAIPGYESLPAVNVVQRLTTLTSDEIEQIRRFEVAHRGRRTILAKIDVLQGA